jgi:hypothetical protein
MQSVSEIVTMIRRQPLMLNNEKRTQSDIEKLFIANGVLHKREVDLGDGDVIDFMLPGGLGLEVKLKESKRAIYRQCSRYCKHPQVSQLILVSATALGFPETIEGKPCYVVSLGTGWL